MITIEIEAAKLLKKLNENRAKHVAEFEADQAGYRKAYVKALKKAVKAAEDDQGTLERYPVNALPVPESHERDYVLAISMVEQMDETAKIALGEHDYKRLWLDEWDWKHAHAMTGLAYRGDHGEYPDR